MKVLIKHAGYTADAVWLATGEPDYFDHGAKLARSLFGDDFTGEQEISDDLAYALFNEGG